MWCYGLQLHSSKTDTGIDMKPRSYYCQVYRLSWSIGISLLAIGLILPG